MAAFAEADWPEARRPAVVDSFTLRDLGTHELDDFDRPVRLYELVT